MKIVAIIPRRADGGRRDQLWAHVRARFEREHPDIEIWEGHQNNGPFNAAKAFNRAAHAAGKWDIVVFLGSDMVIPKLQLVEAINAASHGQYAVAYSEYRYVGRDMSDRILDGFNGDWSTGVEFTMGDSIGGCGAVSWDLWQQVGGYDEGFEGWGGEDFAFYHACSTFGGTHIVNGPGWHLWHPGQPTNNEALPGYQANMARMRRYGEAAGDSGLMTALLDELRFRGSSNFG